MDDRKEADCAGNLAIIPARSGSKGVRDKNIRMLAGKPLLQYSVEAALNARIFDCIHVSTDSTKYADIARKCGADVPFLRDKKLALDMSDTWDAVRFVLEQYKCLGKTYGTVTVLQPTSPLRSVQDIRGVYSLLCKKNAKSVVSVTRAEHSPLLMGTLDESLSLDGFADMERIGRRQDMPVFYRVNGAVYMMRTCVLERMSDLYGNRSYAYVMPAERSVDIDSLLDFKIAEVLLAESLYQKGRDEVTCG